MARHHDHSSGMKMNVDPMVFFFFFCMCINTCGVHMIISLVVLCLLFIYFTLESHCRKFELRVFVKVKIYVLNQGMNSNVLHLGSMIFIMVCSCTSGFCSEHENFSDFP